jgi:hypothetical protein
MGAERQQLAPTACCAIHEADARCGIMECSMDYFRQLDLGAGRSRLAMVTQIACIRTLRIGMSAPALEQRLDDGDESLRQCLSAGVFGFGGLVEAPVRLADMANIKRVPIGMDDRMLHPGCDIRRCVIPGNESPPASANCLGVAELPAKHT